MTASRALPRTRLMLSEDRLTQAEPAPWIGPLVALGGMASRYADKLSQRQLIVAISVPRRDFAATLVGCGWVSVSPAATLTNPLDTLRNLEPGTPVRIVSEREVIVDSFVQLHELTDPPRVELGRSQWLLQRIKAVSRLSDLEGPVRAPRPGIGSVALFLGLNTTWDLRLASPAADLAIIGTLKWLRDDLSAFLTSEGQLSSDNDTIAGLLLPEGQTAATWFTRFYSSSRLADQLPLPGDVRAVVLDGAGAIRYLGEIESPVVICVLDRSTADETAAEIVMQLRNSRGEPLSLRDDVGWRPPVGIEALAFTVAL